MVESNHYHIPYSALQKVISPVLTIREYDVRDFKLMAVHPTPFTTAPVILAF